MSELAHALQDIEHDIDDGKYRPGPWAAFLDDAAELPLEERRILSEDVSRVSDKLHALRGYSTLPVETALAAELLATFVALTLLASGLRAESSGAVAVAAAILVLTFQPLLKTSVGRLLGIHYAYAFLWKIEPRFKMRFGSYLAARRWQRVTLHAAGCFGFPLALWFVAATSEGRLDGVAHVCEVLLALALGGQALLFVLAFAGFQRLRPIGLLRHTSAGAAGYELQRNAP